MEKLKSKNNNIQEIPKQFCRDLEYFFTDIDDTLTTNGLLPSSSLEAVWALHEAGIKVVPITGRPAGWCDHIARMWPVEGVIGENGAFYFSYDRECLKVERVFNLSEDERLQSTERLLRIQRRVLEEVPGCAVASDQDYRLFDLAIDYCEDVSPLKQDELDRIVKIIEEEKAVYKISSIHINCWYGRYDKVSCLKRFLLDRTGKSIDEYQKKIFFIGDSPNDEPVFGELNYTGAVANIKKFLDSMKAHPLYLTSGESGDGFREMVQVLLGKRMKDA